MEFEDQEEEEHEGDVEMGPSYDSLGNSNNILINSVTTTPRPTKMAISSSSPVPLAAAAVVEPQSHSQKKPIRYRECLKNHAVGIGGHAVDGCGEFLPAGAEGTLDALKCAACNCHRNFHRRETNNHNGGVVSDPGFHFHHHPPLAITHPAFYRTPTGYLHVAPQQHPTSSTRPLALPSTSGGGYSSREEQEDMSNMNSGGGGGGGGGGIFMSSSSSKKRFRTKFSQEQKDKMLEMAERLGWRIQKQDEEEVQQLCNELGIRRHVLKVWMHNNKHTLGKKP